MSIAPHLNICIIVLDSVGSKTVERASLSFLPSLANTVIAESTASYTLPSHVSIFTGILPRAIEETTQLLDGYELIFRSASARPKSEKSLINFEGETLMAACISAGYNVVGFGGTSFFDTRSKGNLLPRLFPKFIDLYAHYEVDRSRSLKRDERVFALNNTQWIASHVDDQQPFFLFINEISTHIPYDHPGSQSLCEEALQKCYRLHDSKARVDLSKNESVKKLAETLAHAQARSLEWCDKMLEDLCARLPKRPTLLLILGDHGEEFGESGRFGHGHLSEEVMRVPLWAAVLNG